MSNVLFFLHLVHTYILPLSNFSWTFGCFSSISIVQEASRSHQRQAAKLPRALQAPPPHEAQERQGRELLHDVKGAPTSPDFSSQLHPHYPFIHCIFEVKNIRLHHHVISLSSHFPHANFGKTIEKSHCPDVNFYTPYVLTFDPYTTI